MEKRELEVLRTKYTLSGKTQLLGMTTRSQGSNPQGRFRSLHQLSRLSCAWMVALEMGSLLYTSEMELSTYHQRHYGCSLSWNQQEKRPSPLPAWDLGGR